MTDLIGGRIGKTHVLAALSLLWVTHVLFFAPTGFLTTDEFLYAAMTDRLVKSGSFFFDNGYRDAPSEALKLLFLIPTPRGLTAQYPGGYAFLAAPFFILGGVRGIIFLNTLAALGMIGMTYRLAKILFDDETMALNAALILGLASFIADYAFAVLPHATAGFFMVSATYFAAMSQRKNDRGTPEAVLSGLFIGLGINIRVDVIILAPLLLAWIIGSSHAPLKKGAFLCAGMVPGLAVASWINDLKFGSFSPITYGRAQAPHAMELTTIAGYQRFLPLLVVGLVAMVAFGFPRIRNLFIGWRAAAAIAVGLLALILVPATSGMVLRILKGLYVLLIDMQSYDYIHRFSGHGSVMDGKWLVFAGGVKKALFESLPYAGFLVLPLARLFQRGDRAPYALLFLIAFAWFAFFSVFQWHGGQATNMRYFTPMLPYVAILAAAAWHQMNSRDWNQQPVGTRPKALLAVALLALVIGLGWNVDVLSVFFLVGTAKYLFFGGVIIGVVLLSLPKARRVLLIGKGLFLLTLTVAFMGGYMHDLKISDMKRRWDAESRSDCRRIPVDALVISRLPRLYYCHLMRSGAPLAFYEKGKVGLDTRIIDRQLDHGRPVLTDKDTFEMMKGDQASEPYGFNPVHGSNGKLYRITRIADKTP